MTNPLPVRVVLIAMVVLLAAGPLFLEEFYVELVISMMILGIFAMTSWFWALTVMPLAEAVSLSFTAPLFIAVGAAGTKEIVEVPAKLRVSVRDTTAAGDAFNAAYLLARLRGAAIREAAAAGHALAARVIQTPGALLPRDSQPSTGPQDA